MVFGCVSAGCLRRCFNSLFFFIVIAFFLFLFVVWMLTVHIIKKKKILSVLTRSDFYMVHNIKNEKFVERRKWKSLSNTIMICESNRQQKNIGLNRVEWIKLEMNAFEII